MTPEERLAEAQAAEAALNRFLRPAFEVIEKEYSERMVQVAGAVMKSGEAEAALLKLATAVKVCRVVRQQIEAVANGQAVAAQDNDRAKQIAEIRPFKRRLLGI